MLVFTLLLPSFALASDCAGCLVSETLATGFVGINSSAPITALDLSQTKSALALPIGTSGARPTGSNVVNGEIRYNTSLPGLEAYIAGAWSPLASGTASQWVNGGGGAIYYNGGYVGIGTTSPTQALDVRGNIFEEFPSDTTGGVYPMAYNVWGEGGYDMVTLGSKPLGFGTNSTEYVTIGVTGKVGIGTTAPTEVLQVVSGNINVANGSNSVGSGGYVSFSASSNSPTSPPMAEIKGNLEYEAGTGTEQQGDLTFLTRPIGSTGQVLTERMRITSGGNVGIGTTGPDQALSVVGSMDSSNFLLLGGGTGIAGTFGFGTGNGPDIQMWGNGTGPAGAMYFQESGATKMTITNAGNVGIGTTGPVSTLDVSGNSTGGNGPFLTLQQYAGNNAQTFGPAMILNNHVSGTHPFIIDEDQTTASNFNTADPVSPYTAYLTIAQSGNVGIGTTSPSSIVHVYSNGLPLQIDGPHHNTNTLGI